MALVGRNESKVLALKQSVCKELGHPGTNVGIIVADATDEKSMLDMAAAADIVIACAGPYERLKRTPSMLLLKRAKLYCLYLLLCLCLCLCLSPFLIVFISLILCHCVALCVHEINLLPFPTFSCTHRIMR